MANQSRGTDWCQTDNPPQHLLHDGQERAGELDERFSLRADLYCGNTEDNRDDQQLQNVEVQRAGYSAIGFADLHAEAEEVLRDNALQESPPGTHGIRFLCGRGINAGVNARFDEQAQTNGDDHRYKGRNGKPNQCRNSQLGCTCDLTQVGNRHHHRGDHQRRDEQLQQRDVGATDLVQRCAQRRVIASTAGYEAQNETNNQAIDNLGTEAGRPFKFIHFSSWDFISLKTLVPRPKPVWHIRVMGYPGPLGSASKR